MTAIARVARPAHRRVVARRLGLRSARGRGDRPKRTVEGARPGSILLLHDGDGYDPRGDRMQTARAVPLIVDRLHAQGYRFDLLDDG